MARSVPTPKRVTIRAVSSFDNIQIYDVAEVELTPKVQGWINAGLVVVEDGASKAGPGGAQPGDNERVPAGADSSEPAGGEPGQGFGASGYGTAPKLDKG